MLCSDSVICPRLRARMALRGTSVCHAVSSAQAAQVKCEAPQMPQARGVMINPACGSLSRRITSKPRNSAAWVQAFTTTPTGRSTRTSRSPPTRPTGEMSRVWVVPLGEEGVIFHPARRGCLRGRHELDVAGAVQPRRQVFGYAHHGLGLEYGARGEVEERKLGLGAAQARHA